MQSHPVPQNITGFQFKLIGFLTIRQFGYLAAAAIFIFVIYSAKLPFIVVLMIGLPVAAFAISLAFVTFNDMPFERWIAAFFHTVYSPNVRVWHREPKSIGFLEPQFSMYLHRQSQGVEPRIVSDPTKLNMYLQSHRKTKTKTIVDINEERRLAQLNLSPFEKENQVFTAANLAPKPASLGMGTPGLQRMSEVVEETKERSSQGGQ